MMINIFSAGLAKPAIAQCAKSRSSLPGYRGSTGDHRNALGQSSSVKSLLPLLQVCRLVCSFAAFTILKNKLNTIYITTSYLILFMFLEQTVMCSSKIATVNIYYNYVCMKRSWRLNKYLRRATLLQLHAIHSSTIIHSLLLVACKCACSNLW
jgi:hypothetical protein